MPSVAWIPTVPTCPQTYIYVSIQLPTHPISHWRDAHIRGDAAVLSLPRPFINSIGPSVCSSDNDSTQGHACLEDTLAGWCCASFDMVKCYGVGRRGWGEKGSKEIAARQETAPV
jgi:hypothetical protein